MPPAPPRAFLLLLLVLAAGRAVPPEQRQQQQQRQQRQQEAAAAAACGLRSLAVRVKDLGLGYASEETVLFKYCGGGCPPARSNHGLALARLLRGREAAPGPCCRPARYEDAAFLDDGHRWHQVGQLSAAACRCVG
ncbi:persephin [Struthio camelus]|uniref:persephin n=1 Tax=Struthio camelus TaxID=8801 RepID=UPI0036040DEC